MNRWKILKEAFLCKKARVHFAVNVHCHTESEIIGEISIGENTNIGRSKIFSKNNSVISIGRNTNVRDHVLIYADGVTPEKLNNIFIGSKVFISSGVEIYGPAIISDETFVGSKTMIINSDIGSGCLIENNVLIKNIVIPSNTVIPSRSVIDSIESLNEVISNSNQGGFCQIYSQNINNEQLA